MPLSPPQSLTEMTWPACTPGLAHSLLPPLGPGALPLSGHCLCFLFTTHVHRARKLGALRFFQYEFTSSAGSYCVWCTSQLPCEAWEPGQPTCPALSPTRPAPSLLAPRLLPPGPRSPLRNCSKSTSAYLQEEFFSTLSLSAMFLKWAASGSICIKLACKDVF